MPLPVGHIQSVLDSYTKHLKTKRTQDSRNSAGRNNDVVSISSEGKRRELMDRIGDAAVKAYKNSIDTEKNMVRGR
jgi:hypothetical protein